ncbi:alpha/beta hydrolase, partial [Actinomycetospora sp.]|uniref:alpha/beta fold hydrolase n=1 Tax=Actinomycetospora sp. TaxID=1872135 RepID=UPI002F42FB4D
METRTLETPEVDLVHDVAGPLPPADGRPSLLMIGQPMDASGFRALASHLGDRTVVTYDPRGLGRSVRHDGRTDSDPEVQAGDLHALVSELGAGPVEVFASSGGAVTALAWVTAFPDDVATLVAHEPPVLPLLPDVDAARRAMARVDEAYAAKGWAAGMAGFMGLTSWRGEYTDEFFAQPLPDPAMFGMPTEDSATEHADRGSRDDPLLSDRAKAVIAYVPDAAALTAAPTRIVVGMGEESRDQFPGRCATALAALLGQEPTVFPSHHGGFSGEEDPWPGQATAFAVRLREVLDT